MRYIDSEKLTLKHPFTFLIAGPSSAGKTEFAKRIILHASSMINPPPEEIIWFYSLFQKWMSDFPHARFQHGLPDVDAYDGSRKRLLILDDLMHEMDEETSKLFTKYSHHRNVSILYLCQNLFHKGKH